MMHLRVPRYKVADSVPFAADISVPPVAAEEGSYSWKVGKVHNQLLVTEAG